jgi:hypothetical protein
MTALVNYNMMWQHPNARHYPAIFCQRLRTPTNMCQARFKLGTSKINLQSITTWTNMTDQKAVHCYQIDICWRLAILVLLGTFEVGGAVGGCPLTDVICHFEAFYTVCHDCKSSLLLPTLTYFSNTDNLYFSPRCFSAFWRTIFRDYWVNETRRGFSLTQQSLMMVR